MASIDIQPKSRTGICAAPSAPAASVTARLTRWSGGINVEGTIVLLGLVVAWQIASFYLPPILFPSLARIAAALRDIVTNPAAIGAIGLTYLRIIVALSIGFAAATAVGVAACLARPLERAVLPPFEVMQGFRRSAGSFSPSCGFATWKRVSRLL